MIRLQFLFTLIYLFYIGNNDSVAQNPSWSWARCANGTTSGQTVAIDASGNAYVAGFFESLTITFGSYTLTNAGSGNIYIIKYDANGNVLWAKSEGGTGFDKSFSLAVDISGNVYMTGYFSSPTIAFGSYTLYNPISYNVFLVKYDSSGNVLWAKSAANGNAIGQSVAVDALGDVCITGGFTSAIITFDAYTLTNINPDTSDIFLVKYNSDGNVLWAKSAGGTNYEYSKSVTVDSSGNAYITGSFVSSTINFDSYTLTNEGGKDIFLAKYNAHGAVLWAKSIDGTSDEFGNSVATDKSGSAYLTGDFVSSTLSIGSYILTNKGECDILLVKYGANGNVIWAKGIGGTLCDWANSIAVDAEGNVYITGSFMSGSITFDSDTLTNTNAGTSDIFLVKYNSGGNVLWVKSAGGTDSDGGNSVATDASGSTCIVGNFNSPTMILGSDTLRKADQTDMFVAKIKGGNMGINEFHESKNIFIYPDPSSDNISIESHLEPNHLLLTIYNFSGQIVWSKIINQSITTININALPKGMYMVKLVSNNGIQVGKFVKQ